MTRLPDSGTFPTCWYDPVVKSNKRAEPPWAPVARKRPSALKAGSALKAIRTGLFARLRAYPLARSAVIASANQICLVLPD
jgi:hypothetical protein